MTLRFTLFAAISVLVHAGLLFWSETVVDPQLQLGGEAKALRVSIAVVESVAPHEPNPQPAPGLVKKRPVENVVSQPDARHFAQTGTTTPGLKTEHPSLREKRESTNTPVTRQNAPDIGRRISVALKNRISSHFVYPWLARQRGWEGQVLLSLTVRGNGDLGNWKVAHTSGYRTLDQSALKAARRIERLPQAASWLNGESLEVQIPVQYQLLDS